MLRRKTMYLDDYTCVFCTCQDDETITHLFLNCPFSQQCWISIGLHIQSNLGPLAVLEDLRRQIAEPFFMEVITLMSWSIWNARNNFIFKNEAFSIQGTKKCLHKGICLGHPKSKDKIFSKHCTMARITSLVVGVEWVFFSFTFPSLVSS